MYKPVGTGRVLIVTADNFGSLVTRVCPMFSFPVALITYCFFILSQKCVFSLAATLWSAADWRLTEAEKPSLSRRLQELLVSMTEDAQDARPGLYDVLQVS